MNVFKEFGPDQMKIHQTRVEINGISLSDAYTASRQIAWEQMHIMKIDEEKVSLSLIMHRKVSSELWIFLKGDEPEPIRG